MAYSYFDYDGTDTTIQTNILCVSTEHMYAFKILSKDNSTVTLGGVPLAATFTKTNAGVLCELHTAPSTKIRIIRSTPYNVLMHDFSNGAQFNADSVDEVYEQLLYLCQEVVEGKLILDSSGIVAGDAAGYARGYADGSAAGYYRGYSLGVSIGYARGSSSGYDSGYTTGYSDASSGYPPLYNEGYASGYAAGYAKGSGTGGQTP